MTWLSLCAEGAAACSLQDRDRYGRIVAICRASGEDLGATLVREGLAWAFVRYSSDYVSEEKGTSDTGNCGRRKIPRIGNSLPFPGIRSMSGRVTYSGFLTLLGSGSPEFRSQARGSGSLTYSSSYVRAGHLGRPRSAAPSLVPSQRTTSEARVLPPSRYVGRGLHSDHTPPRLAAPSLTPTQRLGVPSPP
jgi:Staphylococcal nuclease homologue